MEHWQTAVMLGMDLVCMMSEFRRAPCSATWWSVCGSVTVHGYVGCVAMVWWVGRVCNWGWVTECRGDGMVYSRVCNAGGGVGAECSGDSVETKNCRC